MRSRTLRFTLPPPEITLLRHCVLTSIVSIALLHKDLYYLVRDVRIVYDENKHLDVLELLFDTEPDKEEFLQSFCRLLPEVRGRKPSPDDIERVFYNDVEYNVIYDEKTRTYRLSFKTGSIAGICVPKDRRLSVYGPLAELFVDTMRFWVSRSHVVLNVLSPRPTVREIRLTYDFSIGDLYARVASLAPMAPSVYAPSGEGYLVFTVSSTCSDPDALRQVLGEFLDIREERGYARLRIRGSDRAESRGFLRPSLISLVRQHPDLGYYIVALQTLRVLGEQGIAESRVSGLTIQLYFIRKRDQPWIHTVTVENFLEVKHTLEASASKLGLSTAYDLCKKLISFINHLCTEALERKREEGIQDETLVSHLRLLLDSVFRGDPDVNIMYNIERYWSCPVV